MLYSFVIPCYNSGNTIEKVVQLTSDEMERQGYVNYEFILVNDCSPDGGKTIKILRELAETYNYIKVIDFAKNAGQHHAILAGLKYASGDIIIGMDDDLQTHPSQLPILLDKFSEGYDIVYGYYPEKKHNFFRNLVSKLNYWSVRILIGKPKELKTSSFWVMKSFVRDYVIQYKVTYPYLQGMFLHTTQNIACVPVEHFSREEGNSGYTLGKLVKLWSGIMGFSIVPLRIAMTLGNIFSAVGLVGAICVVIDKLTHPHMTVGWASMMSALCFFSGIILFFIGVVGEYVGRITLNINNEPGYVVREIITNKGEDNEKDLDFRSRERTD